MKAHVGHLMMLALIAFCLTGISWAQQFSYRVVTSIPYDFYVGNQQFSAGNYLFDVNYGDNAVTITNQANGHRSVVLASPIQFASPGYDNRNKSAFVDLVSVNGRYVLSDLETHTNGVTFPKGTYARTVAEKGSTVTIAAALR